MVATGTFSFGERLRLARERAGQTRELTAIEVGRSADTIAAWERGDHAPRRSTLIRLAAALGTSVEDLEQ